MNLLRKALVATAALAVILSSSIAGTITLPDPDTMERTAWLDDAVKGAWGTGNGTVSKVPASWATTTWVEKGSVEGAPNTSGLVTNGWLTINLTSGVWDESPVAGTWTINYSNFWSTFGAAVISMHVGNGGGDPDYFMWLITPGELTGTFGMTKNSGGGAGLSNLKLFATGEPTRKVPDGGTTALLLGAALLGLGLVARRKR
jgi:hypothetical protein